MNTAKNLLPLLLVAATSAYAADPEPEFGDAVRNMMNAQIANPEAARNPPEFAPQQLDGDRAAAALKVYREQASKPAKTQQPLTLSIVPR